MYVYVYIWLKMYTHTTQFQQKKKHGQLHTFIRKIPMIPRLGHSHLDEPASFWDFGAKKLPHPNQRHVGCIPQPFWEKTHIMTKDTEKNHDKHDKQLKPIWVNVNKLHLRGTVHACFFWGETQQEKPFGSELEVVEYQMDWIEAT